ncbi:MAG: GIY-YIG nuclease family protein [Isosphaeraceae bacterium]
MTPLQARKWKERKTTIKRFGHAIKIGVSINPDRRLESLRNQFGVPFKLLEVIPGDLEAEGIMHKRFSHLGYGSEMFYPARELFRFLGQRDAYVERPDECEVFRIQGNDWGPGQLLRQIQRLRQELWDCGPDKGRWQNQFEQLVDRRDRALHRGRRSSERFGILDLNLWDEWLLSEALFQLTCEIESGGRYKVEWYYVEEQRDRAKRYMAAGPATWLKPGYFKKAEWPAIVEFSS